MAAHLRDVLGIKPRYVAKDLLYNKLFKSLGVISTAIFSAETSRLKPM